MSDANVQEVAIDYDVSAEEGHFTNLTEDQHNSLVKMWESYFDICDRAHGTASKGTGFKEEKSGVDLKKSGIPDSDAAKDQAKQAQEMQGMNALLDQYGKAALKESWWGLVRGDSPDNTMLRFIRARKGDVPRALAMMATTLKWRLDSDVETLIANGDLGNGEQIQKFTDQQKSGKVFALGATAKGQPICYVIMAKHSLWAQPAASMQKFIISQMETFRLLIHPPVDKATIVFDLKGFGLKQMDVVNLLFLVKALESYYPETLGTMYVSNAPWIFWGFWKGVQNLLDPIVRNKIKFITGPKDTEGDMPPENVIEYCGGSVKTTFDYVAPKPTDNDPQKDTATKEKLLARHARLVEAFEQLTRAWIPSNGKDAALTEQRNVVYKKLRLSHMDLEPYTRGKNVYQRNGVLLTDHEGISVFDYDLPDGKVRRQVMGKATSRKATEQQLYDIIKNGHTVAQAEEATIKALKDGSFGGWRVNDNSDEIKKVALESLDDVDAHSPEKAAAPAVAA